MDVFIHNLSSLLHPLYELKEATWKYSSVQDKAFQMAKEKIISPSVLVLTIQPASLAGDTSSYSIGAVISHIMPDGKEDPIAFTSRTLLPSKKNFSQIEHEALALIYGMTKIHSYLCGQNLLPLITIFGEKKQVPPMTTAARLQRWALKFSACIMRSSLEVPKITQILTACPDYQ